jgi:hypothetical protein
MRLATMTLALIGVAAGPPSVLAQAQPDTLPSGWCIAPGHKPDSTFVARQAIAAVSDSVTKRLGFVFTVGEYQIIKSASSPQGVIVTVGIEHPTGVGGGGLVWVDLETGCPIVLVRNE